MAEPVVLWLRRQLRLDDNPSLSAALAHASQGGIAAETQAAGRGKASGGGTATGVRAVYIPDPDMGEAARVWAATSLQNLARDLATLGVSFEVLPHGGKEAPPGTPRPKILLRFWQRIAGRTGCGMCTPTTGSSPTRWHRQTRFGRFWKKTRFSCTCLDLTCCFIRMSSEHSRAVCIQYLHLSTGSA